MLRGAQTVANRDKTSTRVSRQDCQKTTQDECQKTSFRNRAEQYWLRPLFLPTTYRVGQSFEPQKTQNTVREFFRVVRVVRVVRVFRVFRVFRG